MIILEFQLAEISGEDFIATTKKIYESKGLTKLPIFVCHSKKEVEEEALLKNFDYFLEKPCLPLQFSAMIKRFKLDK